MPPTGEEQNQVQYALLEKKLASQIADAELFVQMMEDRAEIEHRLLNESERNLAQEILNAPATRVILLESAKLRSFLNHIPQEEWSRFNALAALLAQGKKNDAELNHFVEEYHQFCDDYDKWVTEWVATLDPDTLTALSDALADKDNPKALETIQRITESLVARREEELNPAEE